MAKETEGTKPEETTPEGEQKPKAEETPETPQTAVSEPPKPEATKETTPTPNVPQTPVQGSEDDTAAKAVAEAEAAKAKAAQLELELNRERMARKYGIPDNLVGLLRAESVEADAKAMSAQFASADSGLGVGGLDPTDTYDAKTEGEKLADRLFSANRYF